jgi:hypothetical protein
MSAVEAPGRREAAQGLWVLLRISPPLVLGVEESQRAVVRRRAPAPPEPSVERSHATAASVSGVAAGWQAHPPASVGMRCDRDNPAA